MKKIIRKSIVTLICLIAFQTQTVAGNDKPVDIKQLPSTAQQMIKSHFSKKKVALAKMDNGLLDKSYDVVFTTGEKVEFDRNGNWKEIECKSSAVPGKLVPEKIARYVKKNYPGKKIRKIEKDNGKYEISLSNGMEIKFNSKLDVIDID